VIVVNNPSIKICVVSSVRGLLPHAFASPINAPVSSSCSAAVALLFPQTPAFPVQPLHPAVCSH